MKTALVAGATGLIGSQLLELLIADSHYTNVIAITRKPLSPSRPKLQNIIADADTLTHHHDQLKADDVFCCLGTTMRIAKTKQAFKRVDFEYPLALARLSKNNGSSQFFLVSALGANKSSSIFYNQVKGETEEAIAGVGFESFHILRPSLLVGPRAEHRAGENAAKWIYRIFGFLIPKKYAAIDSLRVARAMVKLAAREQRGNFIHESLELQKF